ncbi:hypothetical protein IU500_34370 [Nocardia terpenica]|uniref:hypothetical protein n=1 Tax=Nocardia terpenica TaxID=455432 RepID=UPI0018959888|nr:hypothetical protein [Nocardia terpenica]MBF6065420.1 hypothetical protein [Nocardia terpenica]MBF6109102.1 hypothetical protein [Nocardia terpenica]MBF6114696.1 hypothetical protein [Nocardia terpenica]MBF6123381.1 hypothetical protein [Nocardia terpenica]MBF6156601.1 hypothetical protein [Nocardia terpenica]
MNGVFPPRHTAMDAMAGPEFTGGGALVGGFLRVLLALEPMLALIVLAGVLLVGVAGCTAAMFSGPHYLPSPNICRSDEVTRTDCVHLTPQAPAGSGVAR